MAVVDSNFAPGASVSRIHPRPTQPHNSQAALDCHATHPPLSNPFMLGCYIYPELEKTRFLKKIFQVFRLGFFNFIFGKVPLGVA